MKLYATITSERATKGQGGNKHLDIILTIEKEMPRYKGDTLQVARVEMIPNMGGSTTIRFISLIDEKQCSIEAETRFNRELNAKKKTSEVCRACKGKNIEGCTYCDIEGNE